MSVFNETYALYTLYTLHLYHKYSTFCPMIYSIIGSPLLHPIVLYVIATWTVTFVVRNNIIMHFMQLALCEHIKYTNMQSLMVRGARVIYLIFIACIYIASGRSLLQWRFRHVFAHIVLYGRHWWSWRTASHYNNCNGWVWSTGSLVALVPR